MPPPNHPPPRRPRDLPSRPRARPVGHASTTNPNTATTSYPTATTTSYLQESQTHRDTDLLITPTGPDARTHRPRLVIAPPAPYLPTQRMRGVTIAQGLISGLTYQGRVRKPHVWPRRTLGNEVYKEVPGDIMGVHPMEMGEIDEAFGRDWDAPEVDEAFGDWDAEASSPCSSPNVKVMKPTWAGIARAASPPTPPITTTPSTSTPPITPTPSAPMSPITPASASMSPITASASTSSITPAAPTHTTTRSITLAPQKPATTPAITSAPTPAKSSATQIPGPLRPLTQLNDLAALSDATHSAPRGRRE